jgi:cobalt-zinc-cadmium efflux system protein
VSQGAVRSYLAGLPGVGAIHDLHIWAMSTSETALTVHLVMPGGHPGDVFLMQACQTLRDTHGIGHATMQVETDASTVCALAPAHVV